MLLPPPARRVPLMIGSNGPRMLAHRAAARRRLEHVVRGLRQHAVEGFAALVERIGIPAEVERSACVLVGLGGGERSSDAPAVERARLAAHLAELAEAGADEAILVVDPIDERSVRELGDVATPANGGH